MCVCVCEAEEPERETCQQEMKRLVHQMKNLINNRVNNSKSV